MKTPKQLRDIPDAATRQREALAAIEEAVALKGEYARIRAEAIRDLKRQVGTWAAVGEALGITAQQAHKLATRVPEEDESMSTHHVAATISAARPAMLATLSAVEQLADAMEPVGYPRGQLMRQAIATVNEAVADLEQHPNLPYLLSGLAPKARAAVTNAERDLTGRSEWNVDQVRQTASDMRTIIGQSVALDEPVKQQQQ